ncbi:MAG: DEAD/DEAH box helicase family protein [Victivallales bacterium]
METLSLAKNNLSEDGLREFDDPKHLGKVLAEVYDFKRDDRVRFMTIEHHANNDWGKGIPGNDSMLIKDFIDGYLPMLSDNNMVKNIFEKGIFGLDFYIGHCTHDGSSRYRKENCVEITCLVIDIDFGSDGHKKVTFETESDALRHMEQNLPDPTMILRTGGGFQVIYKLAERIPITENKDKIEAVTRGLTKLARGDSCHTVEHVFRLPFSYNNKIRFKPRPVRIIKYNPGCSYTLGKLNNYLSERGVDISKVELKEASPSSVSPSNHISRNGIDRSAYAYYFILAMIYAKKDEQQIIREIKKTCLYGHYRNDDHLRQEIRNIKKGVSKMMPVPKNDVIPLDSSNFTMSYEVETKFNEFNTKVYKTTGNTVKTLKVLEWITDNRKNAIMALPCGVGKSTSAIILASAKASPDYRIMIVTRKVEDVIAITSTLRILKAKAIEWNGFNEQNCHLKIKYSELKHRKDNPCVQCPTKCTASNKRLSQDKYDCPEYDILVTTHAHYRYSRISGKLSNFSLVIIDEAPSEFESYELNDKKMESLEKLYKDSPIYLELIRKFLSDIDNMLSNGSCKDIPSNTSKRFMANKSGMFTYLNQKYQNDEIGENQLDTGIEFLNYFSDSTRICSFKIKDGDKRYKYCFSKGNISIDVPVQHIILDGSALLSDVEWKGFNIYRDSTISMNYPNTRIHVLRNNPSKQSLMKDAVILKLQNKINEITAGKSNPKILLMKNKEPDGKLKENIEILKSYMNGIGDIVEMARGKHVGSNDGKDCDINIIAMSLFNNVEYYVLKAALASDKEIESDRIWKSGMAFEWPCLKKDGGFVDLEINKAYIRCSAYDLYQAIMRGIIRSDSNCHYEVVFLMSSMEVIRFISDDLKDAIIIYDESPIVQYIKSGKSQAEIKKLIDNGKIPSSTLSDRIRNDLNDFTLNISI